MRAEVCICNGSKDHYHIRVYTLTYMKHMCILSVYCCVFGDPLVSQMCSIQVTMWTEHFYVDGLVQEILE